MPVKNPFEKVETFKNGTKIKVADDDFQYFEDYKNLYNQFELISTSQNQDTNSQAIKDRIHLACGMYRDKKISMNMVTQFIKDPSVLDNKKGSSNKKPELKK